MLWHNSLRWSKKCSSVWTSIVQMWLMIVWLVLRATATSVWESQLETAYGNRGGKRAQNIQVQQKPYFVPNKLMLINWLSLNQRSTLRWSIHRARFPNSVCVHPLIVSVGLLGVDSKRISLTRLWGVFLSLVWLWFAISHLHLRIEEIRRIHRMCVCTLDSFVARTTTIPPIYRSSDFQRIRCTSNEQIIWDFLALHEVGKPSSIS